MRLCGQPLISYPLEALSEAIVAIGPRLLEVEDPEQLFDVNAPEDLLQAAAILDRRRRRWASRT